MTTPQTHPEERRQHAEFARRYSEQAYQVPLQRLHRWCHEFNDEWFGSRLIDPHIALGRTAPRSVVHVSRTTNYGGQLQITFNERLIFGTNPDWTWQPWRPEEGADQGIGRFLRDLALRATVRQYVLEVSGLEERGYRGFGPAFTEEANRIGVVLGLPPVVVDHRRSRDEGQPLARGWPHCLRGRDEYGDDITETLWELAAGGDSTRRPSQTRPNLGLYEYLLYLLTCDRQAQVQTILTRQVDWLQRLRERRLPSLLRVEDGKLDVDGKTPLEDVTIDPDWLSWNNRCVRKIAEGIQLCRSFGDLPILADALEDAGCTDVRVLRHARARIEHTSRCWVLRKLLDVPGPW